MCTFRVLPRAKNKAHDPPRSISRTGNCLLSSGLVAATLAAECTGKQPEQQNALCWSSFCSEKRVNYTRVCRLRRQAGSDLARSHLRIDPRSSSSAVRRRADGGR